VKREILAMNNFSPFYMNNENYLKNWIACNFRGSPIDIRRSTLRWFESICIPNYWSLP